MELQLTEQEYRRLVELVSVADWVLNATRMSEDEANQPYREITQKLFGAAEEFNSAHLIGYDREAGAYYSQALEDQESEVNRILEDYEESFFWDELVGRLAERDLIEKKGEEEVSRLAPADRIAEEDKLAEKYLIEFQWNGLWNLRIVK